jgi:hypothetical protein
MLRSRDSSIVVVTQQCPGRALTIPRARGLRQATGLRSSAHLARISSAVAQTGVELRMLLIRRSGEASELTKEVLYEKRNRAIGRLRIRVEFSCA